ncbi:MAG: 3-hydroxyacyl-CoA dehydrogenase family protein [Lachnospiraceae bacterium]|jgi:3-hydroxyacyl-CoA dehydrogenase
MIKNFFIVGGGVMSCRIGIILCRNGYKLKIYDINPKAIENWRKGFDAIAEVMKSNFGVTDEDIETTLKNISFAGSLDEAAESDMVIEAVIEDLEVKKQVVCQIEEAVSDDTIIVTNTSSLTPSLIAENMKHKERFAAWHFNSPNTYTEVMGIPETKKEVLDTLKELSISAGEVPIVLKKEKSRYLANNCLQVWLMEALDLIIDGYGTPEDLDRSWMMAHNHARGPFAIMDFCGLDLRLAQARNELAKCVAAGRDSSIWIKRIDFLEPMVERGELGVKSGKGFYTYPNPAYEDPEWLRKELYDAGRFSK